MPPPTDHWLSRNDLSPSDKLSNDLLNSLANDDRNWGGNVNGGGYILSNVVLQGSGGFQFYPSPLVITPNSGSSCVQLDQTVSGAQLPRWSMCKDQTAESGGNSGSNFSINRYDDTGTYLSTPIAINRASGLITMGAQQWAGAVNGGGNTLTNVVLSGVTLPGAVPTTRQILTGLGLSGGGDLSVDRTIAGVVMGASGGAHAAGLAPDPGATAGQTHFLREDATWAVPPGAGGGTANYWVNGALVGTRGTLNLIAGTNVTIGGTDTGSQVNITISATGSGGTGSPQTPWASNIDAAGFALGNLGRLGIGLPLAQVSYPFQLHAAANENLIIQSVSGLVSFQILNDAINTYEPVQFLASSYGFPQGNLGIGVTAPWAPLTVAFGGYTSVSLTHQSPCNASFTPGGSHTELAIFHAAAAPNAITLQTRHSGVDGQTYPLMINPLGGNVGIGNSAPNTPLYVIGTSNGPSLSTWFGHVAFAGNSTVVMEIGTYPSPPYAQWMQVRSWNGVGTFPLSLNPLGGNVGIGTSTPVCLLSLGPSLTAHKLALYDNGGTYYGLGMDGAAIRYEAGTNGGHTFYTNAGAVQALTIMPAGSVGIGIAPISATFPLVVHVGTNLNLGVAASSGGVSLQAVNDAQNTYTPLSIYAQSIALQANVGIGTGGPRSLLSLIPAGTISTPGAATQLTIGEPSNNPSYQLALGYYYDTPTSTYRGVIQAISGGGGALLLLNPSGGAVGVAKTAPGYALDVTGDVNCTGAFRVNGTALATGGGPTTFAQPGKVANTIYSNGTGKPLYVSVAFNVASASSNIIAYVGGNPPGTPVAATGSGTGYASLFFIVLPGQFYQATTAGPTPTLNSWTEWN